MQLIFCSQERQAARYEAEMALRAANVKDLEEREKRGDVVDVRQYKEVKQDNVEVSMKMPFDLSNSDIV